LECWPSVIYHHVGDRDAVVAEVVDRVLGMVHPFDDSIPWRQSFETTLGDLRVVLRDHPGVARWLTVTGPVVPAALRGLDRGIRILAGAGFGDEAAIALTVLLNFALQMIVVEEDGTVGLALSEVPEVLVPYRDSTTYPGLAAMSSFVDKGDFEALYRYGIVRFLDGISERLAELNGCDAAERN
jgi:hypothetical protein